MSSLILLGLKRWWPIILLLLSACRGSVFGSDSLPAQPPTYKGSIVAMGNSLTEGLGVAESEAYPAQLERKLQADGHPYQVVNAGISGETSRGALARAEQILALEPDIVILETGVNDGPQAIPPVITGQNLSTLITTFTQNGVIVVLAGMQSIQPTDNKDGVLFSAIYPALAEQHAVIFIPLFLEGVAANPALNQADGIHPTAAGYTVIVEQIYPFILQAIDRIE